MISDKPHADRPVKGKNLLGRVYRCRICGAELSVIKSGSGRLRPICCNTEMTALKAVHTVYVCSICFSELMVIRGGKNLEPVCCNKKMIKKR